MQALKEFRSQAQGLSDLLNYAALIDSGVVQNKDGSIMVGYFYRSNDITSSTEDERNYLTARINAALARLGNGFVTWHDAVRIPDNYYPSADKNYFPDPVSKLIDDERRKRFQSEDSHFVTEYVLVISYMPPLRASSKLNDMLWQEQEGVAKKSIADQVLEWFYKELVTFEDMVGNVISLQRMKSYQVTDDFGKQHLRDELFNYLGYCITNRVQEMNIPHYGAYLDVCLGAYPVINGDTPKIADNYICPIVIEGLPPESYPNILHVLEALPLAYRWSSRMIYLDQQEAVNELMKIKRKWKKKVRGFFSQIFKTQNGQINEDALLMSNDVDNALTDAQSGLVTYGFFTSVVVIIGQDYEELQENARFTIREIQRLGFQCRVETINALEAWLGTLPGHAIQNVRRPLIHTLNQADLIPLSSIWAGRAESPNPYLPPQSPPLMYALTNGGTPFRINLHVDDLGHTLIFGPTGAGKSVLLNMLDVQFLRYQHARIYSFDKGRASWGINQACGGKFFDIAGESSDLNFAPLSELDTTEDFMFAQNWLETLYQLQTETILTPEQKKQIVRALELLKTQPKSGRTLTAFNATVQDQAIRDAISHYTLSGTLGSLLDAEVDGLSGENSDSWWVAFEIESLMNLGEKNLLPVLLYLFRRIEKSLDGRPTLLVLDEAWLMLGHPVFREKIREWLKVLRKANCSVVMATQSLSDMYRSGLLDVLLESCPTKILLPNPEADKPGTDNLPGPQDFYVSMGLNETEIYMLKNATKKRDYYFMQPEGKRLFQLGLDKLTLSFAAINYKTDGLAIKRLMDEHGENWPYKWLDSKGVTYDKVS